MNWWTDPKQNLRRFNNCQRNWSVMHREKGDGFQFPNEWLGATEQRWFSHWGSGCLAARQLWCRPLCLLHNTAHRVSELNWSQMRGELYRLELKLYRLEAKQRCGAHSFGPWGVSTLNTNGQHRSLLFFFTYTYISGFSNYQRHQKKRDGSFKITQMSK